MRNRFANFGFEDTMAMSNAFATSICVLKEQDERMFSKVIDRLYSLLREATEHEKTLLIISGETPYSEGQNEEQ